MANNLYLKGEPQMGSHVIINGLNGELARVVKSTRTDTLNHKNEWVRKLLAVLEEYATKEKAILANETLTQQGKREALAKLGTETAPQLKWIENVVRNLEKAEEDYRTRFFTVDSGLKDATERLLTLAYMWSKLDALDLTGRMTRFAQAAKADEVVVMAAMLENPLGPMVTEEVKERELTGRAKRLFPQAYDNFEQNTYLSEVLKTYRNWVGRWLVDEVGVEIKVIRENLGDEIADTLMVQQTGLREPDPQPVGVASTSSVRFM